MGRFASFDKIRCGPGAVKQKYAIVNKKVFFKSKGITALDERGL